MYKRIYVEVTNLCNLSCSFCTHNKRESKNITIDEFTDTLDKIKDYTKYLFFHVLGEPLIHPDIDKLIDIAHNQYSMNINLTTNGFYINRIKGNHNLRQINISLHSFIEGNNKSLEEYMNDIFSVVDEIDSDTYISYRLWARSKYSNQILEILNNHYNTKFEFGKLSYTFKNNVFLNTRSEFVWPSLNRKDYYSETGSCLALKDHLAILVDGTVVPCCLDGDGIINFGNIHKTTLYDIIHSDRYAKMAWGLSNNIKCEELCKHCNFRE